MDQVLASLEITLPVFALIAVGYAMHARGWMNDNARSFITNLVYYTSLPALIFCGIVTQPVANLFNLSVIVSTAGVIVPLGFIVWMVCRLGAVPAAYRGPLIVSAFWGNVTYLGFPLAQAAWGAEGFAAAGIVNAFAMPVFVIVGTMILVATAPAKDGGEDEVSLTQTIKQALGNPIVLAAFAGIGAAVVSDLVGYTASIRTHLQDGGRLPAYLSLPYQTLQQFGTMGLPLALLSVGAVLDFSKLRGAVVPLIAGSLLKLVVTPAIVLGIFWLFFPSAAIHERGVSVLLMGMPLSVGGYVISAKLDCGAEFMACLLILTTLLSCVTASGWLLVLL